MERFTPLYAIILNMENSPFDKESYFNVLVFYVLFYERNRKHSPPRIPIRYRTTSESLEELEIAWKHSPYTGLLQFLHFNFSFSENFHSCFSNCFLNRNQWPCKGNATTCDRSCSVSSKKVQFLAKKVQFLANRHY